jgi:hypothetical protein
MEARYECAAILRDARQKARLQDDVPDALTNRIPRLAKML